MDLDHDLDDDVPVKSWAQPCPDCGRTESHTHALLDFLWPDR